MPNAKIPREKCINCGIETKRARYKYCNNACQLEYQHKTYIEDWRSGKKSGLQSNGVVSTAIKKFLRIKYDDKCCLCGWCEVNPVTGKVPLVADHIDGNWRNNTEDNLRLICPNCDSLSPTYAALNKGNGRNDRARSKRAQESVWLHKNANVVQW